MSKRSIKDIFKTFFLKTLHPVTLKFIKNGQHIQETVLYINIFTDNRFFIKNMQPTRNDLCMISAMLETMLKSLRVDWNDLHR